MPIACDGAVSSAGASSNSGGDWGGERPTWMACMGRVGSSGYIRKNSSLEKDDFADAEFSVASVLMR